MAWTVEHTINHIQFFANCVVDDEKWERELRLAIDVLNDLRKETSREKQYENTY